MSVFTCQEWPISHLETQKKNLTADINVIPALDDHIMTV